MVETLPSLNPQGGAVLLVAARLSGSSEGFRLRVFTKAHTATGSSEIHGSYGPGWHALAFPYEGLSNGVYYYEVHALNRGRPAGLPRLGKVMILN